ncbi:MAG: patatin-like phospholipase family protein [Bacteroidales bacterium]|nr:patatin-like phospholipase family protein [Bacteroidales bacterium]
MKKIISAVFVLLCLGLTSNAQILPSANPQADSVAFARVRERMDSIRQYRPTVGLVLAGGGARGLAHLGVIRYMEELGIPVDVITGTSMGGLIGGLYAMGYKHDQLDSLVRDIDWPIMMSDDIPNTYVAYKIKKYRDKFLIRIPHKYDEEDLERRLEQERIADKMAEEAGYTSADILRESINKVGIGMPDGYLYGLNVRNLLSSVSVGYQDSISFADLPIPYACVATDLYTMTPKYWTGGDITTALRSTMAIPFYFRAVRGGGEILLDGGMRNNFPVDLAKEMGADIVIGSDMAIHRELNELNSPVDFLFQTITLLASGTAGPAMEMLDLDVHHELKGYNMLSFDDKSVDDIIDQGYQNALAHKDVFQAIANQVAGKPDPHVASHDAAVNLAQTKVRIAEVRFQGIDDFERDKVLLKSDYSLDGMYDRAIIERMLNRIYGTNAFEAITYHLEGQQEPYTLVFDCQKGPANDFGLGVRADTDETVALALHYGLGTRRLSGPRLAADIKLGTNPSLSVDWKVKSRIGLPTMGVNFRNRLVNTSSGYMSDTEERRLTTALDLYMEDSRMLFGSMRVGLTAEMNPYERILTYQGSDLGWDWKSYWLSAFASFKYDTFDDGYFPTRGVRASLGGRYVFKGHSEKLNWIYDMEPDPGIVTTPGGAVPDYWSTSASFGAAFSIGSHFAILPFVYMGWYAFKGFYKQLLDPDYEEWNEPYHYMSPYHVVTYSGFLPDRYSERQLPFFGFSSSYKRTTPVSASVQLDLRYCFSRKNYITLRGGFLTEGYLLKDLIQVLPIWAVGTEYARQSMVGPLKVAVQWGNISGFNVYASIGFDF